MNIFLIIVLGVFHFSLSAQEVIEKSTGKAYNKVGKLVYIEKHAVTKNSGRMTRLFTQYYTPSGIYFGRIESDFSKNPNIPLYTSEDMRFDRTEGIKFQDGQLIAYAKTDNKSAMKEMSFKEEKSLLAGQGLHYFLQSHLKELINKKDPVKIKFLIPINQDTYGFQIKTLSKSDKIVSFRVQFNSWFLRMIAPQIDTTYEIESGRLLSYDGPSNLLTDDKKSQHVTIKYIYEKVVSKKEPSNQTLIEENSQ